MPEKTLVAAADLRTFAAALLETGGLSAEHAATTADVFVWAAQRGVESHGIARVPGYLDLLAKKVANPDPRMKVESSTPAAAVLDADRAPGPVALTAAAEEAVTRARRCGIASVGVRQTVHTGAIGRYVSKIAEAGLVGIGFVAGMPNMGYTGVKGPAVATSPLAIAVPTPAASDRAPLLLDMATATIALGKIRQAKASGTPLPEGAAATADGTPTTDPERAVMPLPLGGAKGSGMSLSFELLTSVLVGAPIFAAFHSDDPAGRKHRQNALLIAVDPAAFGSADTFLADVDTTLGTLKGLPGDEGVYYPGERSAATADARGAHGIPVAPKVWKQLTEVAAERGVPLPAHL
ncbi:Ldh family oxidoreductase [Streptomyces sp. SID8379]|uniref:Ldh family oxidoreductase n=1 Tax=unclassified Streptomyces TaxID=2593676 RepID=UPI00037FFCAC|nr:MULTISPECIES: Ldh family oxidoreductase [unclassified Streptomyces]MYW67249.1 Ldh family oxidoreductase [Streptomyces sp. SID8379]